MMKTTQYYNMDIDRLLIQPLSSAYTTEELLLMGEGSTVLFYDDKDDMDAWAYERDGENIIMMLETINERIAVIIE